MHENAKRGDSRLPATGSNRHDHAETRINRPPPHFNGKEGVSGSSPEEGFHLPPVNRGVLLFGETTARVPVVHGGARRPRQPAEPLSTKEVLKKCDRCLTPIESRSRFAYSWCQTPAARRSEPRSLLPPDRIGHHVVGRQPLTCEKRTLPTRSPSRQTLYTPLRTASAATSARPASAT